MCNKIDIRMECYECGYPFSEAAFSDRDNGDNPFPCDTPIRELLSYIEAHPNNYMELVQ